MLVLGMLVLGTGICLTSLTHADPVANATSGATSRIALVNLAQVFKNYSKVASFSDENKQYLKPLQEKAKSIAAQIEVHEKELQKKELPEATRTQYEKNLVYYKRQMEDITNDAKMQFTKKNEEQMVVVYREISDYVERYAVSQGFDLVMHFNDVPREMQQDFFSPVNVSRKIQAGACIPMYIKPGVDVTKNVTDLLNESYKRSAGATAPVSAPAPAAPRQ